MLVTTVPVTTVLATTVLATTVLATTGAMPDFAGDPVGGDLADVTARFSAALRRAGLPVGPGRSQRFAAAVTLVRPATRGELFNCALATLVSGKDQAEILRAVFTEVFGSPDEFSQPPSTLAPTTPSTPGQLADAATNARMHSASVSVLRVADNEDESDESGPEVSRPYLGSTLERLSTTDFAELSDAELAELALAMRQFTLAVPSRRSRRRKRRAGGRHTDVRSTLRQARRTGGHAFRLIGEVPARRPRRLVVLCDISGSMESYARAMIQLLYCAAGGAHAEVFSFATRLTRLTAALARSSPAQALARAGKAAPDWHGGTRLGAALKEFNDRYGRRGMARGAVVLIISDGWDTGDPGLLRREMERLSLVAFRIVWVNPRTKSSSYEPLAAGMAAAWPHCDAVVSGHSLESIDRLAAALADPVRRREEIRAVA
ncbi:MAG TPA: VWA domain-containing protein [Streptosporangiaceae bacterium]|nr:VWA domain-containing protein [Streptosporangiaceae bacterium]